MSGNSERGIAQILLLILLVAGLGLGVYLVQQAQIFKSKASISSPTGPQTAFVVSTKNSTVSLDSQFSVSLNARSDVTASNLFVGKLKFPSNLLEVVSIDYTNTFVQSWVEQFYDNSTGDISLIGAVPDPGYKTDFGVDSPNMATITFRAKQTGSASVSLTADSAIYRNSDNTNILAFRNDENVNITSGVVTTPAFTPTPAPTSLFVNTSEIDLTGNFAIGWSNISNPTDSDKMILSNSFGTDVLTLVLNYNCRPTAFNGLPQKNGVCSISRVGYSGAYKVRLVSGATNSELASATFSILAPTPTPAPSASPSASPTICAQVVTPALNTSTLECVEYGTPCAVPTGWIALNGAKSCAAAGDFNKDGKTSLADASALFSQFNKKGTYSADINQDGVVNTIDLSILKNLLIKAGVLRAPKKVY